MNCGMECVKYLLFIFNFVFALGGLAILVVGVLIRYAVKDVVDSELIDNISVISVPATVLIVIGAIIFIIAFFGCCGAIRESHCMIVTFAVLLLTLLVIQVSIATYAFIKLKDKDIQEELDRNIQKSVNDYFTSPKAAQDGVDSMQALAQCCGYRSYRDFYDNSANNQRRIPGSCCSKNSNESCEVKNVENVPGCKDKMYELIQKYATYCGGLALGIAAVELIGIIFSFCLANSIRNVERRGYKV